MRRVLYLGYYFYKTDWKVFRRFLDHAEEKTNRSWFFLISDAVISSLRYNISPLEYFQFGFYQLAKDERSEYAGTGFMYEYQRKMNPAAFRKVLRNKIEFLSLFGDFIAHDHASIRELKENQAVGQRLLSNPSHRIVLKNSEGQCGIGILVLDAEDLDPNLLLDRLKESRNDLAEEYIVQHKLLNDLSASGLNTIRIITQIDSSGEVIILAARLRITVNSVVDNLAAGNLAAPVDISSGIVNGPAVYSDITKNDVWSHPVSGINIDGFRIPYWKETLDMILSAALVEPRNRSVGWDVAITDRGPELVEGNHDWCKLLWQLPVRRGLKSELLPYFNEGKGA